jgi:hypothetical protein
MSEPTSDIEHQSWAGLDLPVAITEISGSSGRVAYEAVVDGRTAMIVVDAATGEELARFDSDPAGRIAGVQSTPLIKEDVLFVVGPVGSIGGSDVKAVSLLTLETVWSAYVRWAQPPRACGDHVCLTGGDGSLSRFEVTSGELLDRTIFSDPRVVGIGPSSFEVRPMFQDSSFSGLSGVDDYGFDEAWTVPVQELQDAAGQLVSANGGWSSSYDEGSNTIAQWLGPGWHESAAPADAGPITDRPLGAAFGLDVDTGEIRWATSDVGTCNSLWRTGYVAFCRRSSTLGDFEDPRFETDLIEVFSIDTGQVAWRYQLDQPVPVQEVDVSAVGGSLAVDVASERVHLEPFAGIEVDADDEAQIMSTCEVAPYSFADVSRLDQSRRYRSFVVPPRETPCLADGTLLTPEEALTQFGELPPGFAVG